ncbi:putative glucan 4-alpha-glucosidase [Diaporthe ampelina]|uniref:Putative glucan 4-alpha-glucosidase n=1 Tax=Diaporthe ampelina TaxID=1214573 RepID=A0A0G2H8Z1_9PEZI|nr:putative glucan 4-alpha-glucosidase [Diaporthe ampelina]
MAPAKPSTDEGSKDRDKQPSTPRRASAARNPSPGTKRSGNNGVATPPNRRNSAAQTPKSAPAATGPGGGTGGVRKASAKKPVEPTLLGDFLLGRPSAARIAASKRKSLDAAAVRAELHQQMRQDAVRRVQQPGKVQARVKAWQKASAAAVVQGNPDEAASEPTEVAIHVDADSVTEEDRVRIKSRQKPRRKSATSPKASPLGKVENRKETAAEPKEKPNPKEVVPDDPRIKGPPKKRIVSDEHWMKRTNSNNNPKAAAAGNKPGAAVGLGPSPIPKDFLQKTAVPPKMQNKIKDWASKVELPASPEPPEIPEVEIPKASRPTQKYNTRCGETIIVEEAASGVSSTAKTQSTPELAATMESG